MQSTPTKRRYAAPAEPVTPDPTDTRGQMAKLISPELRAKLASIPSGIRAAVSTGGNRTTRTPLGASRSEPMLDPTQPIFESGRDTMARTYLGSPTPSTPSSRGLQPMCEINEDSPAAEFISPASRAARERLWKELQGAGSQHAPVRQPDFGVLGTPAAAAQQSGNGFFLEMQVQQSRPNGRALKRSTALDDDNDNDHDGVTDEEDATEMDMDSSPRPVRALPSSASKHRKAGLGATRSMPALNMEEDF